MSNSEKNNQSGLQNISPNCLIHSNRKLTYVELYFVDESFVKIPFGSIGRLNIENLTMNFVSSVHRFFGMFMCKHFLISLNSKLVDKTIIDRLHNFKDLLTIFLQFNDNTCETIKLPVAAWPLPSPLIENMYQKSIVNKKGDLFLIVSESKSFKHYINDFDNELEQKFFDNIKEQIMVF